MERVDVLRALGTEDDAFFAAVRARGEELIEVYRAQAGEPDVPAGKGHALACMSSAVDAFVAELEEGREVGRKLRGGLSLEEIEGS